MASNAFCGNDLASVSEVVENQVSVIDDSDQISFIGGEVKEYFSNIG